MYALALCAYPNKATNNKNNRNIIHHFLIAFMIIEITTEASRTPNIRVTKGEREAMNVVALSEISVTKFTGSVGIFIF